MVLIAYYESSFGMVSVSTTSPSNSILLNFFVIQLFIKKTIGFVVLNINMDVGRQLNIPINGLLKIILPALIFNKIIKKDGTITLINNLEDSSHPNL